MFILIMCSDFEYLEKRYINKMYYYYYCITDSINYLHFISGSEVCLSTSLSLQLQQLVATVPKVSIHFKTDHSSIFQQTEYLFGALCWCCLNISPRAPNVRVHKRIVRRIGFILFVFSMPRVRKRVTNRGVPLNILERASDLIRDEGRTVRAVAKDFAICHTTLFRFHKKREKLTAEGSNKLPRAGYWTSRKVFSEDCCRAFGTRQGSHRGHCPPLGQGSEAERSPGSHDG